jgi:hypothetical protein
MVDIAFARKAYNERTMSNIGLIRSEFNPLDGLVSPNDSLLKLLMTSSMSHPIEQFVVERDQDS